MASVYLKRRTWYLRVMDASGRWRAFATRAATKTEARRLAFEMERQFERQRRGMEPPAIAADLRTVDDLVEWWNRHLPAPRALLRDDRADDPEAHRRVFPRADIPGPDQRREDRPVSHPEGTGAEAREREPPSGLPGPGFQSGPAVERFPRPNPVVDVPKRKVPKGLPDYLRPQEVPPLLASLHPKWRDLFATAIYTGMRKGELFALRKRDVDLASGMITVCRSHDRGTTKGGRAEAVPINSELLTHYLQHAMDESPSDLVFPGPDGRMHRKGTQLELVLRRAMRRAGLVTGYVHKCRRKGCGHQEPGPDATIRHCPRCNFRMFPVGDVRKIRFHHLRHTTASLLLMSGAELAAVQRIMRHQDPRITTEVYGHLAADYLKREVERLHFGPPAAPSQAATSPPQVAQEPRTHVAAGGAPESPLPAAHARAGAPAAPLVTRLLPTPQKGRSAPIRPRAVGKDPRRLSLVGVAGFEPTTSCSQSRRATSCATPRRGPTLARQRPRESAAASARNAAARWERRFFTAGSISAMVWPSAGIRNSGS